MRRTLQGGEAGGGGRTLRAEAGMEPAVPCAGEAPAGDGRLPGNGVGGRW